MTLRIFVCFTSMLKFDSLRMPVRPELEDFAINEWLDDNLLPRLTNSEFPIDGIKLHLSDYHKETILKQNKTPKYTFGISTGHAGSTSLSSAASYNGIRKSEILFEFETMPEDSAQKNWFDKNPSETEKKGKVEHYKMFVDEKLSASHKVDYVDLGHQNIMGLLHHLPSVFGDDTFFVRFRRDRLHTARSFGVSFKSGICDASYRICPLYDEHLVKPSAGWGDFTNFKSLSSEQQSLWFVDEIEAQFQKMLFNNQNLSYIECNWDIDLRPCFNTVAKVLGVEVVASGGVHKKEHITHEEMPVDVRDFLIKQDLAYQQMMNFDHETIKAIKAVQFLTLDQIGQ